MHRSGRLQPYSQSLDQARKGTNTLAHYDQSQIMVANVLAYCVKASLTAKKVL